MESGSLQGSFAIPLAQLLGSVDGQLNSGVGVGEGTGVGVGTAPPQSEKLKLGHSTPSRVHALPILNTLPQAPTGSLHAVVVTV